MKQVQHMMSRWVKGFVMTASLFVFSVSLASGGDITTAPNTGTPYSYSDPNSTTPSYNDVGRPVGEETQSLMLNNQALGLGAIPVTVSTGYSANYGYEFNASFSHMLGFYDAISLLGAYAPQENRVDITWAHAWTENQRTKLSVERLEEAMDFDYDSGSVTEWVPQYSYGAGYQYLFNKNWLKNVELSGYYAKAQSQDLSTIQFTNENGVFDNYRHIAGATSKGSEATLNVSPWKTGLVGLGLNYDNVNYDTKYSDTDAEDASGLGFTLSLEQLLSKHVKLNLEGSQREVYDDYVAGVSFLTPSNLEVGVNGERTLGENGSASDSRFNLNLAYFFDDKNRYQNGYSLEEASESDLATWASKSVAYMDEVLAAADQQTVQVNAPQSTNPTLQSADTTPEIMLTVGEINHIDISDYIAELNLTDAQKQSTPVIKGGPSDVEFTYDNATESLVTKAEVPESVTDKESAPLVLVFKIDATSERALAKGNLRDALTDSLTFKVTAGGSAPTLNPNFALPAPSPVTGTPNTWVFKYENIDNPTDPLAMFINSNGAKTGLKMSANYPTAGTSDPNKCYTWTPNDTAETLTITAKAATNCPGNAAIQVKTTNGSIGSPIQTITFTALPAGMPSISGGAISSPVIFENQTYSPGHTFTTTEVSPGENETFNTETSDTYVKVFDTGISGTTCTDVTSEAGWNLGFTNGDTQAILQSSGAVPANLSGHQLKIYLHVTNNAATALTADNGTTSNCGGTPFTATVQGAPYIPQNIPLGGMTVDNSYKYDFMTDGGSAYNVTSGSSPITSFAGSTITVKNDSGVAVLNGVDLSSTLGLALTQQGSNIVLSGIINPGYAGDTVYVTLNLANQYGTTDNSAAPAFSEQIAANSVNQPTISAAQTLGATVQGQAYHYLYTTSPMTPGNGEHFNVDETTVTVIDVGNGNAPVDGFSLEYNSQTDPTTVTYLNASAATIATVKGPLYVTYTATNGDEQTVSSPEGQHDTIETDIIDVASTVDLGSVLIGAAYPQYSYLQNGKLTAIGSTGLSPDTSSTNASTFTMTLDGRPVTAAEVGITPVVTANDILISGTPNAGYTGALTITFNVKTPDGLLSQPSVASLQINANPDIAHQPHVTGQLHLTNGVQYEDYTSYTFSTANVYAGEPGSGEEFSTETSETYAIVTDSNGVSYSTADPSSPFTLTFLNNNTQLQLNGNPGHALQAQGPWTAVLYVQNRDGATADNAGPGEEDTFTVTANSSPEYQPFVQGDLTLTRGVQYTDYTRYDFTSEQVYPGAADSGQQFLTDGASTYAIITDPNNNIYNTANSDSPFALEFSNNNTQISLIGVAGQPLPVNGDWEVVLHVKNTGLNTAFNDVAEKLPVDANPATVPQVTGGPIDSVEQYSPYNYPFPTTAPEGEVKVYAGDNGQTFDSEKTTWTVTDPNGQDQSGLFTLTYGTDNTNNGAAQVSLTSTTNNLTVQGPWAVQLNVVNSAGQSATGQFTFDVTENPAYNPVPGDTGHALNNAIVDDENSVMYDYTTYASSPMLPGPEGSHETFNTATTRALVCYQTETSCSSENALSGFSLVYNADNTAITGLTASSATVQGLTGPLNVYYQAVNNDNPDNPVVSTVADTIGTDQIKINTTTLPEATVGTPYPTYDFAAQSNLILGSTGLDTANSSVAYSDPDAGFSAVITANNIIVTGTPVAGHSGTTMTFNLQTPPDANNNVLTKSIVVSIKTNGSTPVVTSGILPNVLMGATYNSGPLTGAGDPALPLVSPGPGEYFDENTTTGTRAIVTLNKGEADEEDVSELFHLEYSSSGAQRSGNGEVINNGNNQVSLVSDGVATVAGELTVDFHVVNVDNVDKTENAGTITVGSIPGYLYCPPSSAVSPRPDSPTSNLYDAPSSGNLLAQVRFNKQSSVGSGTIQLSAASLSNGKLTCQYGFAGDDFSPPQYVAVGVVPSDAKVYGPGWVGNACTIGSNVNKATADNSCQITYSFNG